MEIKYKKYSGAGNDFIIIDNRDEKITNRKSLLHELMDKPEHSEIDGLIFIENSGGADFKMNYFNRDGSGDALCGNGLRCTARFILDNEISDKVNLKLEAVNKIFDAEILDDKRISVSMPPPEKIRLNFPLKVAFDERWKDINCSYVDIGSDHIVIFIYDLKGLGVENLEQVKVNEWGRVIRMHKDLMPEGANVNFVNVIDAKMGNIEIRTFERGVEAETLACGTGSVSSAIVSYLLKEVVTPVNVLTRSQEILTVDFIESDGEISNLKLTGPAVRIE
jgi:diaminopimelate epimerase